jgi:hypothetical protein
MNPERPAGYRRLLIGAIVLGALILIAFVFYISIGSD